MQENILLEVNNLQTIEKKEISIYGTVFKELSFTVLKNSITTLFAPLGSGKSTLMKKILTNNNSSINFFGQKIYYVPQYSILVEGINVEDNIRLYVPNADNEDVKKCLSIVGLEGYEKHIPIDISKGFILRVAIAIGFLIKADLLLLDDVFLSMKYKTKIDVFNLITELKNKYDKTFFITSSNFMDSVVVSNKILIAKGNPFELLFEENIELIEDSVELRLQSESFLNIKDNLIKKLSEKNIRDFII